MREWRANSQNPIEPMEMSPRNRKISTECKIQWTIFANKDIQESTSSLVKEDGSADATHQYTDFGETTIQGNDQAKMKYVIPSGIG